MCGRYVLNLDPAALQQAFNLESVPPLQPRYNIAPTQPVPVITSDAPQTVTIVQWGLVPSWAKDPSIGSRLINARSETVDSKPSFRGAFKYRRCLVPSTGFYEWRNTDTGKQPYLIHMRDDAPFAFAGLWEEWHGADGSQLYTCTVLTTEPNEVVAPLHNRMAVILEPQHYDIWLDKNAESGELKSLLQPYPAEPMEAYPVSRRVNNPRYDDPQLIQPFEPPQQQRMF